VASICIISAYASTDAAGTRLVEAYASGARRGGHRVDVEDIGALRLDMVAAPSSSLSVVHKPEPALEALVHRILAADHLVLAVPVNRTHIPPLLHSFVNRVFVTDAFGQPHPAVWGVAPFLNLRTARIVSTLDAGSWEEFQRTRTARFHPLKKSVLEVMGFKKVRTTTVPPIYDTSPENPFMQKWIGKMAALGEASF